MDEKNKRHVELPMEECINDLMPQDQLVYLGIRSFMNKDTMRAFPSLATIAKRVGCCINTVRKCIDRLVECKYITIEKKGKSHIYIFNKAKQFEPFSYEFLENRDLSFTQRAFLASSQRFMQDKQSGIGKVNYSKMELAEKINMPYPTLVKATKALQDKDLMELVQSGNSQEMQFDLQKYHQGIVKVLLNHSEVLTSHEYAIEDLMERVAALEKENQKLKNTITL